MATHRSGSYEYNAICDICGWKYKASELRLRWDGWMVCDADYETRNILDFYRTRNDSHKLPFIAPDGEVEATWTPVFVNVTQVVGTGSITNTARYVRDTLNNKINFTVQMQVTGNSTIASAAGTVSLPVNAVSVGSTRVFDGLGNFLGNATVPVGAVANLPTWAAKNQSIIIRGSYGV